jgi:glycosyltransferase involved in cell wall biosynthesis
MYAGRLDVRRKGLDVMLEAFSRACREAPEANMRLVVAGRDFRGGKTILQQRARNLGIQDRVELPGLLAGEELSRAYINADAFILLSRNDAFSISAAEALFFCKPVILSEEVGVGSYQEIRSLPHVAIAPPDVAGIARVIARVSRDIEALTRAARENLPRVKAAFSWQRAAALSLEAYRRLLH